MIHYDKDHNTTATDLPFNYGDLLHAQLSIGVLTYRFQIAFQNQGKGIKTRRCWGNNNSWTTWKSVYDESTLTDSTLLGPLASALGGVFGISKITLKNVSTYDLGVFNGIIVVTNPATDSCAIFATDGLTAPQKIYGGLEATLTKDNRHSVIGIPSALQAYDTTCIIIGRK